MEKELDNNNSKPLVIKSGREISISEMISEEQHFSPNSTSVISIKEKDDENQKWYLPKLNINDKSMWESQPLEKRRHLTDEMAYNTCLGNCCGVPGLKSACCYLDTDDLEHVLGPMDEKWIKDTVKWLRKQGIMANRNDLVIDFEEGKLIGEKFFNGHQVFQSKTSYPILRFQVNGPRFSCKFLSPETKKCTIYVQRPDMCKKFYCKYLTTNFLIKTPDKPNTWQKID